MFAMLRTGSRILAALSLLLAPAVASAQLPAAAELFAAYNKAIGGEAAFARHQGMHAVGSFSIPSMGMTAGIETYSARPNKMLIVTNIPGMGEMRQGYDGTTAWAIDPMRGARILEGAELTMLKDRSAFDADLRKLSDYKSAETVEKTTMGGQECYKVKLVWNSGRESFDCYSTANGLLVARIENQESDMGRIEAVTLLQDYTDFDGLKLPKKNVVQAMGMEQVITIDKVEFTAQEDTRFDPPAEIKALIKK
jgi:hypothetical protein